MATPTVRVGLNLSMEAAAKLEQLAAAWSISKTAVINKVLLDASIK